MVEKKESGPRQGICEGIMAVHGNWGGLRWRGNEASETRDRYGKELPRSKEGEILGQLVITSKVPSHTSRISSI